MADAGLDLVLEAASLAARAHRHQERKDGRTPYAAHPVRVAFILRHVFGVEDPETLAAAFLHDTIEDTTVDRDELIARFGERVASLVALLSKDKRLPEEEREASYLDALERAPLEARLIKLADVLDNLSDAAGLDAAGRARAAEKSRSVVERLGRDIPERFSDGLAAVRRALERVYGG